MQFSSPHYFSSSFIVSPRTNEKCYVFEQGNGKYHKEVLVNPSVNLNEDIIAALSNDLARFLQTTLKLEKNVPPPTPKQMRDRINGSVLIVLSRVDGLVWNYEPYNIYVDNKPIVPYNRGMYKFPGSIYSNGGRETQQQQQLLEYEDGLLMSQLENYFFFTFMANEYKSIAPALLSGTLNPAGISLLYPANTFPHILAVYPVFCSQIARLFVCVDDILKMDTATSNTDVTLSLSSLLADYATQLHQERLTKQSRRDMRPCSIGEDLKLDLTTCVAQGIINFTTTTITTGSMAWTDMVSICRADPTCVRMRLSFLNKKTADVESDSIRLLIPLRKYFRSLYFHDILVRGGAASYDAVVNGSISWVSTKNLKHYDELLLIAPGTMYPQSKVKQAKAKSEVIKDFMMNVLDYDRGDELTFLVRRYKMDTTPPAAIQGHLHKDLASNSIATWLHANLISPTNLPRGNIHSKI